VNHSQLQDVTKVDEREARRVNWLTFKAQEQSHEQFEKAVVALGFARMPKDDEEREREGYVIFHEGQLHRIVVYDEYSLSSDGSDQGRGGRPAVTHSNPALPEAGKPTAKSGKVITVMQGTTLGGEALPPYIMDKSSAKVPKASLSFIASMPQIKGRFGFQEDRYFDVPFTMNEKGGMNSEAHRYVSGDVCSCYPTL
jgi:hypothetical protein